MSYEIIGKMTGQTDWEELDTADDKKERDHLVAEYKTAFGPRWEISSKKVKD